jgi:hypothetical protein
MIIKFVASKEIPVFKGQGEIWRDGNIREVEDANGIRLLGLHKSPFIKVDDKEVVSPDNKMIDKPPESKMPVEDKGEGGKPVGENLKKKFKPKGWGSKKGKKK